MANAKFIFPAQFLWGTATSSHQVEGNNRNNNWSRWEKEPGKILNNQQSGSACDWWNGRWREDFQRAADTGQNAHRMSIEWSRIQPSPDTWDENALDHYREMIRGLISLGMKPLITLHHFTDPLWFSDIGGWKNPGAPEIFAKYAAKVVPALKPLVTDWVTINEPNVAIYCGYITGVFPPGEKRGFRSAAIVLKNLIRAHALTYKLIHHEQPEASVGIAINMRDFIPATNAAADRWLARVLHKAYNDSFIEVLSKGHFQLGPFAIRCREAKNTQDFLGLNYYTGSQIRFSKDISNVISFPEGAMLSDSGFIANEPESFARALDWAGTFGLPVIITENGVENDDDHFRREYLADHIHQLWRAWSRGIPVKGYFHWTLVDNFEWERGWTQRFGLWQLEPDTQKRIRRDSVDFYEAICRKNALESEDLRHYALGAFLRLFG